MLLVDGCIREGMFLEKRVSGGELRVVPDEEEFDRRVGRLVELLTQGIDTVTSVQTLKV